MKIRNEDGVEELVLNLTPMIDVIFLLLIFFMVATTFQDPERELDVDLPQAQSGSTLTEQDDEIIINVMRDGSVVLSERTVTNDELVRHLNQAAQQDPETPVTIRGDRFVHHEDIVSAMDACGSAGLHNLSIGTLETK
ncbi:MAG: biopolymer transporter ExbD [Planctomycetota bacterium]|nr:biopolymer transporter ExbD [Planctomycetota bacterium]